MQGYPHLYVASASAGNEGNIVVTGEGLPDLETASPPQFDGPLGVWSPETLFSAAVADCFILTFRAIARASKFEWTSLECRAEGVLERPEKTTFFTTFNVHAVLHAPAGAKVSGRSSRSDWQLPHSPVRREPGCPVPRLPSRNR